MRRPAELQNDSFLPKFFAGVHSGNATFPEFEQGLKKSPAIGFGVLVKEINVTGETRVAVINHCFATNHQITHPLLCQKTKEGEDVARKTCAF